MDIFSCIPPQVFFRFPQKAGILATVILHCFLELLELAILMQILHTMPRSLFTISSIKEVNSILFTDPSLDVAQWAKKQNKRA